MNHKTQLDLRLAGSKQFGLLLKLDFHVLLTKEIGLDSISRYRIVSLVEKTFQTANKQGCSERKLLHVKMSSGATYAAVGHTRTCPRAILLALTKISRIDGLPFFLTHGVLRTRGAPLIVGEI